MDYDKIKKLKEIKIEDYIWVIYIGIIVLSWYSNDLERNYIIYDDKISKQKYQEIIEFIFLVLFIIYLYFFNGSYKEFTNLKENDSDKKKELVTLSFIATLLLLISGGIFLYIAFSDNDLDVELAFN